MRNYPNKKSSLNKDSQQGSITLLFCILSLLIIGAVSYSLYVGQEVERKIQLQNAADLGGLAMANHSAQGLNMIAVNNLSIGGAIHVAGAVPILAAYISVLKIFTAQPIEAIEDAVKSMVSKSSLTAIDPGNAFQKDVWNPLALLPGVYMQTAAGLTSFNDFIKSYWLVVAPVHGVEITRANVPDAISAPFQKSRAPLPIYMAYDHISKTVPQDAICHAIKASKGIPTNRRDDITSWLMGPLKTLVGTDSSKGSFGKGWQNLMEKINKTLPMHIGFIGCGYGVITPLFKVLKEFASRIVDNVTPVGVHAKMGGNIKNILIEIRGDAGTVKTPIGRIDDYKCSTQWNAMKSIAPGIENTYLAVNSDYAKAHILYKSATNIVNDRQNYYCEEKHGEISVKRQGHIPIANGDGSVSCLDLSSVSPLCAYKEPVLSAFRLPLDANCGAIKDRFRRDWAENDCRGYNTWAQSANNAAEDSEATGIAAADWGRQSKSYAEGGDMWGRLQTQGTIQNRLDTLGFLFPEPGANDDYKEFKDSITFLNIAAKAVRTQKQMRVANCPPEFLSRSSNGSAHCDDAPMTGLSRLTELSNHARYGSEQNLASGGMNELIREQTNEQKTHSSSLKDTWSRSQWIMTQSQTIFERTAEDPTPISGKAQFFWPAWRGTLTKFDFDFVQKTLAYVTSDNDDATAAIVAQLKSN